MTARTDRIDELLRQEIGVIISREIADPRVGFATDSVVTTRICATRRCSSASSAGGRPEATLSALGRAMPSSARARQEAPHQADPTFHLELDDTLERGTRVLHLLNEARGGHEPTDDAAIGESLPTPVARLPHEGDADPPPGEPVAPPTPVLRRRRTFKPTKNRSVPGRRRR